MGPSKRLGLFGATALRAAPPPVGGVDRDEGEEINK